MPEEPQRHKYYQSHLSNLLQSTTALISNYYKALSSQAPQLSVQANRIWELSQRERLVAGANLPAACALLSACHEAYQSIYDFINQQHTTLDEITSNVQNFEQTRQALAEEPGHVSELDRRLLAECNEWSLQTLSVLHTQAKYLELHARLLTPKLVQSSTVKQFINDLELTADHKANICIGLAQAVPVLKLLNRSTI